MQDWIRLPVRIRLRSADNGKTHMHVKADSLRVLLVHIDLAGMKSAHGILQQSLAYPLASEIVMYKQPNHDNTAI